MGLSSTALLSELADEAEDAGALYEPAEPTNSRIPSSPSNSWSSTETAVLQTDSPLLGDGEQQRRPKRCKISREQLAVLISSFEEEPLPNFDQRQGLAKLLGMTPRSVQIWFQNRRQRLKPMQPKAGLGQPIGGGVCLTAPPARSAGGHGLAGAGPNQQQQLGMPGLAAAAGLCNSSTNGFESLVLGHAISQLHATSGQYHGSGGIQSSSMSALPSYDVMEPFAATKALLGAGYQPASSLSNISPRNGPTSAPMHAAASLSSTIMPSALAGLAACAPHAEALARGRLQHGRCTSPAAGMLTCATASSKSEKADGLLMLLACADTGSQEQPIDA